MAHDYVVMIIFTFLFFISYRHNYQIFIYLHRSQCVCIYVAIYMIIVFTFIPIIILVIFHWQPHCKNNKKLHPMNSSTCSRIRTRHKLLPTRLMTPLKSFLTCYPAYLNVLWLGCHSVKRLRIFKYLNI